MTGPIVIEFEVACAADHAFETWTTRISSWWPRGHTVSKDPCASIEIEPRRGGRIVERTPDGAEHQWGLVTGWEPPSRLGYLWWLGQDPSAPTTVEVRFSPLGERRSRVVVEHDGWQQLGADAEPRRRANRSGWDAVLPAFLGGAQQRAVPDPGR